MENMNLGPAALTSRKTLRNVWIRLAVRVLVAVLCTMGLSGRTVQTASAGEAEKPSPVDFHRLEGRWIRPDGGYVLELRNIRKDGSVGDAAYLNPRPIHVFRAEVSRKKGGISLFVELRDVNYPGSTYNLQYDEAGDRWIGTYFQAMEGQTFDVAFIRMR